MHSKRKKTSFRAGDGPPSLSSQRHTFVILCSLPANKVTGPPTGPETAMDQILARTVSWHRRHRVPWTIMQRNQNVSHCRPSHYCESADSEVGLRVRQHRLQSSQPEGGSARKEFCSHAAKRHSLVLRSFMCLLFQMRRVPV